MNSQTLHWGDVQFFMNVEGLRNILYTAAHLYGKNPISRKEKRDFCCLFGISK